MAARSARPRRAVKSQSRFAARRKQTRAARNPLSLRVKLSHQGVRARDRPRPRPRIRTPIRGRLPVIPLWSRSTAARCPSPAPIFFNELRAENARLSHRACWETAREAFRMEDVPGTHGHDRPASYAVDDGGAAPTACPQQHRRAAVLICDGELSRYDPAGLARYLEGKENWLLTEFIELAPMQFIDELVCEMTSLEFGTPGIRPRST